MYCLFQFSKASIFYQVHYINNIIHKTHEHLPMIKSYSVSKWCATFVPFLQEYIRAIKMGNTAKYIQPNLAMNDASFVY